MASLKKPANAPEPEPATAPDANRAAGTFRWQVDYSVTGEEMLLRAEMVCRDPVSPFPSAVRVHSTVDNRTNQRIFQLKDVQHSKTIVQVQDNNLDGVKNAERAIKLLQVLHSIGASKADLERCKTEGVFFGVCFGRPRSA